MIVWDPPKTRISALSCIIFELTDLIIFELTERIKGISFHFEGICLPSGVDSYSMMPALIPESINSGWYAKSPLLYHF